MSYLDQTNRMRAIERALGTKRGIDAVVSAYRKTNDVAFKKRLLFLCWHLTFHTTKNDRAKMAIFLQNVLERERNDGLRKWAATALAYCGLTSLNKTYQEMLKSKDPTMWNCGAWGLWRIGSDGAINTLLNAIKVRRTNENFRVVVKQFVLQDSNQWTKAVIQSLNAK